MLHDEHVVTFSEAARSLPKVNGRRPHASSIWRWVRKGIRGVKLESRRVGGRFVTSLEALERFSKALAEIDLPDRPKTTSGRRATSRQRAKPIKKAEAVLTAGGIL
ncbi:MAG: DUF1580 domain-containing protein [Phycisphaerae bacterium]